MKHGIKLRKLQRTPSHRWALLRNLVSALLHHEAIKTTLPKAKEAARLAEKMITLGKKGTNSAQRGAMAFLQPSHSYSAEAFKSPQPPPVPSGYPSIAGPSSASSSSSSSAGSSRTTSDPLSVDPETFEPPTSLLPKLFSTLADRYAARPGGYTRIHKFGRRPGDNAPHAILELVDGPKDLRFEMTARAVGRERAQAQWGITSAGDKGKGSAAATGAGSSAGRAQIDAEGLRARTRIRMDKALKFRDEADKERFEAIASQWGNRLAVEEAVHGGHRRAAAPTADADSDSKPQAFGRVDVPGERLAGMPVRLSGLGLARGALGKLGKPSSRFGRLDRTPQFLSERRAANSESTLEASA